MILELPGPWPRAALLGAAQAAVGRRPALLLGDGWCADALAIDPIAALSIPFGAMSLEELTRAVCGVAGPSASAGWNGGRAGPRAIGYVAYEGARDLERSRWTPNETRPSPLGVAAVLHTYAAVATRDPRTGRIVLEADDAASAATLRALLHEATTPTPRLVSLRPTDTDDAHASRVTRALELIAAGDLYQVSLARELRGHADGTAAELLAGMLARTTASFGAALELDDHLVVSSSPELFLDVVGDRLRTTPIKGTRPRGLDAKSDAILAQALDSDPKERAELTMVVDLERNDLGRVARIGSVRVGEPHLVRSRTVHHRVCDVFARRGTPLSEVLAAMLPSGSVTGAPKVRAMEVIAALEATRRGLYCGAIVAFGRDGALRSSMAIRTLVVDRTTRMASYHSGGGIVAGSDPSREVAETLWKARQVMAQ